MNELDDVLYKFECTIRHIKQTAKSCFIDRFMFSKPSTHLTLTIFINYELEDSTVPMQIIDSHKVSSIDPFDKDLFENIINKHFPKKPKFILWKYGIFFPITKSYSLELECLKYPHVIFSLYISLTNAKTDHHGFQVSFTIYHFNISLNIYNKNHATHSSV